MFRNCEAGLNCRGWRKGVTTSQTSQRGFPIRSAAAQRYQAMTSSIGAMATTRFRRWPPSSELDLLRNSQCVVYLDTEVTDGAFEFGVAEKDLDRPKVSGLLVDKRCLGSSHRMRSVGARFKPNAPDPSLNDARVLSGREVGRLAACQGTDNSLLFSSPTEAMRRGRLSSVL